MLQKRTPQGFNQITPYIMAFTAIAYIVMGGFVIKRSSLLPITAIMANILGVLFIIYGLYRGWRAYKAFTDKSEN
jgi:hypothetical protein